MQIALCNWEIPLTLCKMWHLICISVMYVSLASCKLFLWSSVCSACHLLWTIFVICYEEKEKRSNTLTSLFSRTIIGPESHYLLRSTCHINIRYTFSIATGGGKILWNYFQHRIFVIRSDASPREEVCYYRRPTSCQHRASWYVV